MLVDYDEIVREWAYRVPDGKPDLNNAYHKDKLIEVHFYENEKICKEEYYNNDNKICKIKWNPFWRRKHFWYLEPPKTMSSR